MLPAQFGLVLSAAGQYSSNILPSSEQVSFGSWRYAMGYPQGEQSGDKGVGASLEINRRFNTGWRYLSNVQPYALVDYARTWYNNASLQQLNQRHLSSVALGLRFTDDKVLFIRFQRRQARRLPHLQRRQPRPALQRELLSLLRRILNGMPPSRTNRASINHDIPRLLRQALLPVSTRYVTPDVT